MKIIVCGGDERSVRLIGHLLKAGHKVSALCLEKAALLDGCRTAEEPETADAVILPVPAAGESGLLNAPLGSTPCRIEYILDRAGDGAFIIGGRLSAQIVRAAKERGQSVHDYMLMPEFTAKNAAITAEGAISRLMDSSEGALCDKRILVVGWGRIGKLLLKKLGALCPSVYLMSANPEARALASELGFPSLAPNCGAGILHGFDAVINTAPAPVIPELCALKESCRLFELASAPGGIDVQEAGRAGLKCTVLRALPGKYAPESAALAVFRAVEEILKERGEE